MTNDEIYKKFGERIKELRKERGLTQAKVASDLGIAQPTIYKYEKGLRNIPMSVLQKFANYFEMSITELIGAPTPEITDEYEWIEEIKSYNLSKDEVNELMNFVRFIVTKRN